MALKVNEPDVNEIAKYENEPDFIENEPDFIEKSEVDVAFENAMRKIEKKLKKQTQKEDIDSDNAEKLQEKIDDFSKQILENKEQLRKKSDKKKKN